MLPPGDCDQPFADPFCCRYHFLVSSQLSLCLVDLILNLLTGVIIQRRGKILNEWPQWRIAPARKVLLSVTQGYLNIYWQHPAKCAADTHFGIVATEDHILIVLQRFRGAPQARLRLEAVGESGHHGWARINHAIVEVSHQPGIVCEVR
ncbi:hypothetical protein WK34_05650 [Burkholderia vietnamiensis]|nr:hypothetical protein WK34_05650 [Burkholderia vietnamiensis]